MKQTTVPIDHAGRIVLPKYIRQELAIKAGDTFRLAVHGETVTLTPNKAGGAFVRKGKALVFVTEGEAALSAEKVQEILQSSRAERDSQNISGLI